MFDPVESSVSLPKQEEKIIRFWKERQIYEKSLAARAGAPPFVFYEGPPTANGLPHPGHCLTRAIKDLFPATRPCGASAAERKAGWDTHGLPVEVEVCKELGIHSKEEIEAYGVEPFIHKCIESVFRYTQQWEELTERLGFWIHLDEAYVTFHQSYVESVWWALKTLFDRGLLYQGHKIVWWWAQGGTALSSGEVGQGYREVADPSVFVRFPLVDTPLARWREQGPGLRATADADLLVWTTTPWTLPSNQFAAVKPDLEYSVVRFADEPRKLVLASALVETIAKKIGKEPQVEAKLARRRPRSGSAICRRSTTTTKTLRANRRAELKDRRPSSTLPGGSWRPISSPSIPARASSIRPRPSARSTSTFCWPSKPGLSMAKAPQLINCRRPRRHVHRRGPRLPGPLGQGLRPRHHPRVERRGLLLHQEQYLHDYPFCWRAEEDPLIQYPRKSWFIRTTQVPRPDAGQQQPINWLPEHIRDGRFGNFLETNVDWALSRERYWGTPLPIWVCEETGYMEAVGCYEELRQSRASPALRSGKRPRRPTRRWPTICRSTSRTSTR